MKTPDGSHLRKYGYYSGMAFQMVIIIAGGTYGGIKLDEWLSLSPLFTILCSLGAIAISFYLIFKNIKNIQNR
ncbi:AtpZ/AtpI family protein [Bacteroidales bacterium OttesenSCG-928-C03]|nr:AtpZ/AtpI family protein [Bacteroidales bacterium OttesenSCG-928-C03]MDL2325927.1 AtpZ/AtpI family protein [Bacteroidales bacterium OttesenSCG-928-A14]